MKKLTFFVLPRGAGRPISLSVSYPILWIVVVAFAFFLSIFGVLLRSQYTTTMDTYALHKSRTENELLREKLSSYEMKLEQLNSKMEQLIEFDTKLRVLADLEPIDEDIRKLGIGGNLPIEKELRDLNSPLADEVESFSSELDELLRHTELQALSFEKINSHLDKTADLRNHTPSIRPCAGWFVSGFGYRKDPFTRKRKFHDGIDIGAPVGTPVLATADGIVKNVKYYSKGYGRTVTIDHGYGYETVYAHLSLSKVKKYQRVERGDVIALVGNSGRSTGPHLHYEVRVVGKTRNPLTYIIPDENYFD